VISFVRRMNTSPTAPIGSRPISEATNGAAAPEPRSAVTKPGGRRGGGGGTNGRSVGVVAIAAGSLPIAATTNDSVLPESMRGWRA